MADETTYCLMCDHEALGRLAPRVEVWDDDLWRAGVLVEGPVVGMTILSTKAHVPAVAALPEGEATSLGVVLSRLCAVLQAAAGSERVFTWSYNQQIPHVHFVLAPFDQGCGLRNSDDLVRPGEARPDPARSTEIGYRVRDAMQSARPAPAG